MQEALLWVKCQDCTWEKTYANEEDARAHVDVHQFNSDHAGMWWGQIEPSNKGEWETVKRVIGQKRLWFTVREPDQE